MSSGITAFKNLNLGKNSRTIRPTTILAHSAYLFHSFTFNEKLYQEKIFNVSFGVVDGQVADVGSVFN